MITVASLDCDNGYPYWLNSYSLITVCIGQTEILIYVKIMVYIDPLECFYSRNYEPVPSNYTLLEGTNYVAICNFIVHKN